METRVPHPPGMGGMGLVQINHRCARTLEAAKESEEHSGERLMIHESPGEASASSVLA